MNTNLVKFLQENQAKALVRLAFEIVDTLQYMNEVNPVSIESYSNNDSNLIDLVTNAEEDFTTLMTILTSK